MSWMLYRSGRVGDGRALFYETLTTENALGHPGAVATQGSGSVVRAINGVWVGDAAGVSIVPRLGGDDTCYALTAIVSGGDTSDSVAPVNAISGAALVSMRVEFDPFAVVTAGDGVYIAWSESPTATTGDLDTEIAAAIAALGTAPGSRDGTQTWSNVRMLESASESVPIDAAAGNVITTVVVKSNDASNAYGVVIYGTQEPA